jgi:hypothetical protein
MDKLIQALEIFKKYQNLEWPTHCEHDVMLVVGIEQNEVSEEDTQKLNELGFIWMQEYECFGSYRYGSA